MWIIIDCKLFRGTFSWVFPKVPKVPRLCRGTGEFGNFEVRLPCCNVAYQVIWASYLNGLNSAKYWA
jgi:hypothetical protein